MPRLLLVWCGLLAAMGCTRALAPPDLMVVAPHPDDEALNCAGVMQQALEQGGRVSVVILTNGGGYPRAAAALTKVPEEALRPKHYLQLARERQRMSLESMALIGGRRGDLFFLGYPDGGLADLHRLKGDAAYTSRVNGFSQTYGPLVPDHHTARHGGPAPYRPAALVEDLAGLIRERRPREIYVTNEVDTHPDHQAAFRFARDAALRAGFRGPLLTYVGHGDGRPDLPVRRVELTEAQRERKREAIRIHRLPVVHDTLGEHVADHETFWVFELR